MKRYLTLAVVLLSAAPAFADTTALLDAIIGRNLSNAQVSESYINADGTLTGVYQGKQYSGTWELKGGQYCRVIPTFNVDGCQTIVGVTNDAGQIIAVEFVDPGSNSGNRYTIN